MNIVGPENLDELIEDAYYRGLLPSVLVEAGGRVVDLAFLSLDRLNDEIKANLEFSSCYMVPSNYIIISGDIDMKSIRNALDIVSEGEDFKNLLYSAGDSPIN